MNARANMEDRRCPNCGLRENDKHQALSKADCDCEDCRAARMEDAVSMAFEDEYDQYGENFFSRSKRGGEKRFDDGDFEGDDNDLEDDDVEDDDDFDDDEYAEDDDLDDDYEEDSEDDDLDDDYEEDSEDEEEDGDLEDSLEADDLGDDDEEDSEDDGDMEDSLEEEDLDEDMFDDFETDGQASMEADDFEADLLDEGSEDADYDGFLEDADDFYEDAEEMDRRVVKRPCSGVRRIIVRKNRDGDEPLSQAQRTEICNAIKMARGWAAHAESVFNAVWKQKRRKRRDRRRSAWRNNSKIVEWLGSDDLPNNQIRAMRRRARRIHNYLQRGLKIVVIQHPTGKRSGSCDGANAYHNRAGTRTYLCPGFFGRGSENLARTIIHEQVHRLDWKHQKLPGFGEVSSPTHTRQARELARRFPRRARRNAVNIAWLFSEL